ncbi:MAG: threonine--tRNA ligase [Candidatus Aenigmatarchaeota archaeon]
MRILQTHSDWIEYEPIKKEIPQAEDVEKKIYKLEEVLVAFTAVEEGDDEEVAKKAVDEIKDFMKNLKINKLLIYPFVHLSNKPAKPSEALKILKAMEAYAKELEIETYRAPFGWNKRFTNAVKGHPLAEQSRVFVAGEVKEEKKEEERIKKEKFHRFFIIDIDGKEYEVDKKNWKNCEIFSKKEKRYECLKIFVRNELEGNPPKGKQPKHIELMRKLELVDYCPESDVGNMKWYPNGVLIKDLIMDYALYKIAIPWGAMKMQNPLLYRTDVEEIKKLQGEFHERDYIIEEKIPLVLRFASDPGAFPFVQKLIFTYKHMPIKVYEEAICFRKEKKGELSGLMRVRNFWMTDQHAFCIDEEQAKKVYEELSLLFARLMNEIIAKEHWVLGFEIVESFYEKYKEFFKKIIKEIKAPAFFKLMKEMSHYYAFKNEYQAIFLDGNNLQISTVQWDIKNGERFNICFIDKDGKRVPVPFIIHASSFGSIERAIAAILETGVWMEKEGKAPMLPLWLSPEQVRLIPVSTEKHLKKCEEIAEILEKEKIRVGVDDRDLTVAKKVFEAKKSWIPYIIVVGDRELKSEKLPVVIREKSTIKEEFREEMSLKELIKEIKEKVSDMPFRPLYIPRELSKRAIFVPWGTKTV